MNSAGENRGLHPVFVTVLAILVAIGVVSRVAPLFDQNERIFQQFPTEDGYLMLQIARNIAIGNGMSIADGTIQTNGTQPLTTLIWAACFVAVDGAKKAGVTLVLIVQMAASAVAAWLIYQLGLRATAGWALGREAAALGACMWYASPLTVRHTQNCLETGVYALFVVTCLLVYMRGTERRAAQGLSWAWTAGFGALLGLTFLVRNDACLLILAICVVHWLGGGFSSRELFGRRLSEPIVMGVVSVLVASPWLIYNVVNFGHVMPISGIAESLNAELGENLQYWPAPMTEYVLLVLGIPTSLETRSWFIAACLVIIAAGAAALVAAYARASRPVKTLIWVAGLYAVFLSVFYAFFFGVGFFMNRYLFPITVMSSILWAVAAIALWRRVREMAFAPILAVAGAAALVGLIVVQNYRIYERGDAHLHWQVVQWVKDNVPESTWVGAIQTGTLGFFHDKTLNLDGKTNPHALERRMKHEVPEYVVESDIMYLVDWSLAGWLDEYPVIEREFELLVNQNKPKLTVLARKSRIKADALPIAGSIQSSTASGL